MLMRFVAFCPIEEGGNMKIPRQFELVNETIKIEKNKFLNNEKGHIGYADYINNKIILDDSDFWKKKQDEGFCHELVHWILYKMNNDLEKDENFVGLFGSLLHQALKTME